VVGAAGLVDGHRLWSKKRLMVDGSWFEQPVWLMVMVNSIKSPMTKNNNPNLQQRPITLTKKIETE
jgi:hypothetical protein